MGFSELIDTILNSTELNWRRGGEEEGKKKEENKQNKQKNEKREKDEEKKKKKRNNNNRILLRVLMFEPLDKHFASWALYEKQKHGRSQVGSRFWSCAF